MKIPDSTIQRFKDAVSRRDPILVGCAVAFFRRIKMDDRACYELAHKLTGISTPDWKELVAAGERKYH